MSVLHHVGQIAEPEMIRREFPGGLLLLGERIDAVPSLSLGAWVRSGSRHEGPREVGIAHLIEHMLFKGTRRHSALQIAKRVESIGGQVDAYTTKELTCYSARVFAGHRRRAVEILGDLLSQPTFRRNDFERERRVVEEEIHSYDDSPEEYTFERASELLWKGHPLGNSILGRKETLCRVTTRDLRRFHRTHYTRPNLVVAAAGRFDFERLGDEILANVRLPKTVPPNGALPLPRFRPQTLHVEKPVQQTSICLVRRGPSVRNRRRHAQYLLHIILGSGVSSRLFQRIREEEGLAYSIYTYMDLLQDTGMFAVYLAVEPKAARRGLRLVCSELRKVRRHGVKRWELESAKAQILMGTYLSYESMHDRMSRLAHSELYHGRQVSIAETVEAIDRVTREDLIEAAETLLNPRRYSLVTVGPPGHARPGLADLNF